MPTDRKRARYGIHGARRYSLREYIEHRRTHLHATSTSEDRVKHEVCAQRETYAIQGLFFVHGGEWQFVEKEDVDTEIIRRIYVSVLSGRHESVAARMGSIEGTTAAYSRGRGRVHRRNESVAVNGKEKRNG